MAITSSLVRSFRQDLLNGALALSSDTNKLALYTASATLDKTTTAYSATNECPNSGSYAAGGGTLAGFTVGISTETAYIDWTDLAFTSATLAAAGCMIYDSTPVGKNCLGVYDFGGTKSSTAGTFTVVFPAAGASATITFVA